MGNQIIRQPDGRYGVFSTTTDTVVMWDATAEEVIEHFAEEAAENSRQITRRVLGHVTAGEPEKAYFKSAMSWQDAVNRDRERGGEFSTIRQPEQSPHIG